MKIHDSITVYRGESANVDNACQEGLPVFGRFASILESQEYRLIEDDEESIWYVGMPYGSSLCGDGTESEARENWAELNKSLESGHPSGQLGWVIDKDWATTEAIYKAKERHNSHAKRKPGTYGKKYGLEVE